MSAVRRFLILLALATLLAVPGARAQVINGVELVHASLLADTTAVVPGKPFLAGLRLQMEPHWHTYWQYSGDAGLPTKITWQLPAGFRAGPIQWPLPEKISSPGDIENYGYSDEVVLLTQITPPAQLPPGNVTLQAKTEWLVCAQICVPGSKELDLTLANGASAQPDNAALFAKFEALLPHPYAEAAAKFGVTRAVESNDLVFRLIGLPPAQRHDLEFFPLPPDDVQVGHPATGDASDLNGSDRVSIRVPIISGIASAGKVDGVLRVGSGAQRGIWTLSSHDLPPLEPAAAPAAHHDAVAKPATAPQAGSATAVGSFWSFLGIAFLGGLILNVMPCVLPVISLKLFTFIKQANEDPGRIWRMGLAYAAGVFAWFMGFAVLVVLLKAAGRQLGYAFQLQNPWFIVALVAITFVFALNLLGVFEVILPGSISNAAGEAASSHGGYLGAFLQGVLATVLGSACTAPFLGAALGFAFAQSGPVILIMFAAIAAGMSTPFVLLAARPGWLKFLPKPGVWMERVKQATGFLMLATVLWLLSVFGGMRGVDALIWAGVLLLVLGVACWVQGAFNTFAASPGGRWAARAVILLLVVLGGGWCVQQMAAARPADNSAGQTDFKAQLDAALKSDRPVFVDFTASWCVNCKVNERLVLDTAPVQAALRARNAVFLKADWSTGQEDVTKLLQQFHRAAVPLYVIYPAGNPAGAIVLPELLTQRLVLDGLNAADKAAAPHSREAAKANAGARSATIMIQTPNPNTHYL